MVPNEELHILTIHYEPPKRGQPLYKGQYAWSQGVLYMEVPLYVNYVLYMYKYMYMYVNYVHVLYKYMYMYISCHSNEMDVFLILSRLLLKNFLKISTIC